MNKSAGKDWVGYRINISFNKGHHMLNEEEAKKVLSRLKNHPEILETIKELLDRHHSWKSKDQD